MCALLLFLALCQDGIASLLLSILLVLPSILNISMQILPEIAAKGAGTARPYRSLRCESRRKFASWSCSASCVLVS